jgi:hypothetical protein
MAEFLRAALNNTKKTSKALDHERTILTERLPLDGKVNVNFCRLRVSHG